MINCHFLYDFLASFTWTFLSFFPIMFEGECKNTISVWAVVLCNKSLKRVKCLSCFIDGKLTRDFSVSKSWDWDFRRWWIHWAQADFRLALLVLELVVTSVPEPSLSQLLPQFSSAAIDRFLRLGWCLETSSSLAYLSSHGAERLAFERRLSVVIAFVVVDVVARLVTLLLPEELFSLAMLKILAFADISPRLLPIFRLFLLSID